MWTISYWLSGLALTVFQKPRFQRWQVSSYMFLHFHVTFKVSSNICWGFILLFQLICYEWLVSTFCSFLFMYVLLNLCYFVSAHCCLSFVVYMLLSFGGCSCCLDQNDLLGWCTVMEYTGFTKMFFIFKIFVFSLLNCTHHILKYNPAQSFRSLVFEHLTGGTLVTESEFLQPL